MDKTVDDRKRRKNSSKTFEDAKYSITRKKSGTRGVSDPRRKSKPVSVRTEKTQPSRYSELSTQTLRVEDEANVRSLNERSGTDMRECNSSTKYEARTRKSKLLQKRASTILLKQTDLDQAPARSRKIMLAKEHDALSIGANIMPTVRTVKSQQREAEDTNPSAPGSQYKSCNTSKGMRLEVGNKSTFLRYFNRLRTGGHIQQDY
ncbi:hypothetical protein WUBG_02621 [Wuchereria bancrofti]|uniref:Uncharacterized protein n=2 Tax=Wuchereria bancrofti TaxID=6293 RepID=J9FGJ6_WUCBA|nr:hypothetical protein WUBG_02621 [Wuchereria bancrofti]